MNFDSMADYAKVALLKNLPPSMREEMVPPMKLSSMSDNYRVDDHNFLKASFDSEELLEVLGLSSLSDNYKVDTVKKTLNKDQLAKLISGG